MLPLLLALQDDLPQLLEKIEDADAAYRLTTYGKKALPALDDFLETAKDEKRKARAKGIVDAILINVVEDVRKAHENDTGRCGRVSLAEPQLLPLQSFVTKTRLLAFEVSCMCRALRHDGSFVVAISERTGEASILVQTSRRETDLAAAETLARHLRPVKDEADAVAWVQALTGAKGSAATTKTGIEVRVRKQLFRFDGEGKISSVE